MEKLLDWLSSNWLAVVALLVAIFGGVPGIIAVYEHYTARPKVVMTLLRIDLGSLKWPEKSEEYTYVLLEFEVTNEEDNPITLPPSPFSLSVKIDGKWIAFDKIAIPLSGTVLYKNTNDTTGANIDHMDMQKFRELNIGKLYGHYEASFRKRDQYLNSRHYLLFLNSNVTERKLEQTFSDINKDNLPIKITWKDTRGKQHEPFLVVQNSPIVTTGCYKVCYNKIKHYEF